MKKNKSKAYTLSARRILHAVCMAAVAVVASCGGVDTGNTVTQYSGDYCYRGEMKGGKRNGYGVLSRRDTIIYSGTWKNDKRDGYGTATDSLGREITALWQTDTIISGTRTDSLGTYHGGFGTSLLADGHGTWRGADGSFYTGQWTGDRRNGFGCGVMENGKVKAGDWRNDRYRGERMLHTSDRIYGIDLSRHQHEKGRKRYGIDWKNLAITGLGSGNHGMGTYRVSFIYIKSTEGTTVKNRYFLGDYRQARAHGFHVGAYHFFSARSTASQQAHYFLKNSRFQTGDLPPVLDLEPTARQIEMMGGAEGMFRRVRTWLNIVHRATGAKPVLYVGQGFVNKYLPQAPDIKNNYPIWIARYGQYRPDIKLAFWQLTPFGRVRGVHGEVDINVFNGYHEQFAEFMQRETIRK